MLNLAFALLPSLGPDRRDAEEGFLGKLALWARERVRYRRAPQPLRWLDDRHLDVARADLPELAGRHATDAVGRTARTRVSRN